MAYLNEAAGKGREARAVPSASGAPSAGTSEVQTLSITGSPTGGTFKLEFEGQITAAIAFDATAAAVDSALEALSTIGTNNVVCAGGALPGIAVTVTFAGTLAARAVPLITVFDNSLTGGTSPAPAVAETTPGVDATLRDAPVGTMYMDTATGILYSKTAAPGTFTKVGLQT